MELTNKQKALVAIAANEAKGNIEALKVALNEGLEQGAYDHSRRLSCRSLQRCCRPHSL